MASSVEKPAIEDTNPDLSFVKAQFLDAEQSTDEFRREVEMHRQYYDGHQWTEKERKTLESRGQPVITDNKIKDKVETLLGFERESRRDPKAFPRNPSDTDSAEAVTDAIRYVADDNQFDYVRSDASEDMFVEAIGAIEITVDKTIPKKSKVPKIRVRHILRDRIYADPHSRKCDFSDAKYKGIVTWMDATAAKRKWPGKEGVIDNSFEQTSGTGETFDDRPRWAQNLQNRKRVQILDHHFIKDGKWHKAVFCAGGFLEDPEESPYLDDEGEPQSSIEMQALYRQRSDGAPYSMIRRYKDLQDDWNKRRSKSLHLLNTNQVVVEEGQLSQAQIGKVRQEAARPDGVIQNPAGTKLRLEKNLDLAQGHVLLMQQTGQALDNTGPNEALRGQSGSISGIAKQVDSQAGLIAIDRPFDGIRNLTIRVYRQIWNRIQQFWTAEHWIRVREENEVNFIALNREMTRAEAIAEEIGKMPMSDDEKREILQELATNPVYRERVKANDVTQLDVDVVLDEAPNAITVEQEQFALLTELAKSGVVNIPERVLIEASQLRNKDKLLEMMSGTNDPQAQAIAEMQQRMAQLEEALKVSEIEKNQAAADKDKADAEETRVDSSVKVAQYSDGPVPETRVSVS